MLGVKLSGEPDGPGFIGHGGLCADDYSSLMAFTASFIFYGESFGAAVLPTGLNERRTAKVDDLRFPGKHMSDCHWRKGMPSAGGGTVQLSGER